MAGGSSSADLVTGRIVTSVLLILIGCGINNFVLELIIKEDKAIGSLLTFLQLAFISILSLLPNLVFKTSSNQQVTTFFGILKKPSTPVLVYLGIAFVFFLLSVINNNAFRFDISQPVHLIFRSGSLLTTLLIGFFLGRRYSWNQIIGVVGVTIGIVLVTFAEKSQQHSTSSSSSTSDSSLLFIGITLLFLALVLSSALGFVQEWSYTTYGRNWEEGLFWTHFLSLPFFGVMLHDLGIHIQICNQSTPISFLDGQILIPKLWILLALNVLSQYACIMGVYRLTSSAGTLTCTMTITVRKFLSLILSIWYFQNPFTTQHWYGSSLVFLGTILYSVNIFSKQSDSKTKKIN